MLMENLSKAVVDYKKEISTYHKYFGVSTGGYPWNEKSMAGWGKRKRSSGNAPQQALNRARAIGISKRAVLFFAKELDKILVRDKYNPRTWGDVRRIQQELDKDNIWWPKVYREVEKEEGRWWA